MVVQENSGGSGQMFLQSSLAKARRVGAGIELRRACCFICVGVQGGDIVYDENGAGEWVILCASRGRPSWETATLRSAHGSMHPPLERKAAC
jgi:hypothetical protein